MKVIYLLSIFLAKIITTSCLFKNSSKTIVVPSFIPFVVGGKSCQASCEIVEQLVNSRQDILPSYKIKVKYLKSANFGIVSVADVLQSIEKAQNSSKISFSPLGSGPYSADVMGPVMKALDVSLFSQFSYTANVVGNNLYDNIFRTRAPVDTHVAAALSLIVHVGQWKQIGILTSSYNTAELVSAKYFYNSAVYNGVQVLYFDGAPELNEQVIRDMMKSDARVIVLLSWNFKYCYEFLCYAYREGMAAPKFTFLTTPFCMKLNLKVIESPFDWCDENQLRQQLRNTFFFGFNNALVPQQNSTFGIGSAMLDRMLLARNDSSLIFDWKMRYSCFDAMMAVVLTLDKTEAKLNKINRTLSDFDQEPKLIGEIARQQAKTLDMHGLRIGRLKYNQMGEIDEDMFIAQYGDFDDEKEVVELIPLFLLRKISDSGNSSGGGFNVSDYKQIRVAKSIRWMTPSGQPLKDLSNLFYRVKNPIRNTTFILSIVSVLNIAFQISIWTWTKRKQNGEKPASLSQVNKIVPNNHLRPSGKSKAKVQNICIYVDGPTNFLLGIGAVILNIGTITLLLGYFHSYFCYWMPLLAIAGMIMVNSIISIRISSFTTLLRILQSNARDLSLTTVKELDRARVLGILTATGVSMVFVLFWAISSPLTLSEIVEPVFFDKSIDKYVVSSHFQCTSPQGSFWFQVFAFINAIIIFLALFHIFDTRNIPCPKKLSLEFNTIRLATMNMTSLFVATLILFYIFHGNNPIQAVVFSSYLFCQSVFSFSIVNYSSLQNYHTNYQKVLTKATQKPIPKI